MVRASKRLHRIAVRNVSLPTAAVTLRSRRAELLAASGGCKLTVVAL